MAQPKYDSNTGMPIYSVQTDQPAYECADVEWSCATCTETMQVVLSGIDAPCYCATGGPPSYQVTAITGLNGTHTLTRTIFDCWWEITGQGSVTVTTYTDAACTNVDSTTDTTFFISLSYNDILGLWTVFVGTEDVTGLAIYSGTYTASKTCPNSWTLTNTITCDTGNVCTIDEI